MIRSQRGQRATMVRREENFLSGAETRDDGLLQRQFFTFSFLFFAFDGRWSHGPPAITARAVALSYAAKPLSAVARFPNSLQKPLLQFCDGDRHRHMILSKCVATTLSRYIHLLSQGSITVPFPVLQFLSQPIQPQRHQLMPSDCTEILRCKLSWHI